MTPRRRRKTISRAPDVSIIGLGNWGTSLAAVLTAARIPLREVIVRRRRRSGLPLISLPLIPWNRAKLDARILWLCVPDSAIEEVAEEVVRRRGDLSGRIVVHSSGALTVAALEAARHAGARVASVHPAMTFPTRDVVALKGVFFGVEAEDAATRRLLHSLTRRLGGRPFDLRSETKALYHAAGTFASPLLVSALDGVLAAAVETARLAGLPPKIAQEWTKALAGPTARNFFARGVEKSFSGPFARGDAGTIRLHLKALQPHPILADVYRSLAEHAVAALPVRNGRELSNALVEAGSRRGSEAIKGSKK